MAKKVEHDAEKCKGCYYCIDVCHKEAIAKSGRSNKRGYDYVNIDAVLCNGCGACYTVCPDCCMIIVEDEGEAK